MSLSRKDQQHVKRTLRDISFYAAIMPIFIAFAPEELKAWAHANKEAFIPLTAWLLARGYVRGQIVKKVL